MRKFSPDEQFAAARMARADLYFFSRWMFFQRRRYKWLRGTHHKAICDALMRVFRGECKRLIINMPPRYSKTEIAVVNFIAWALGQVPDAEFIHASYAAPLAVNNSANVRSLLQHEAYSQVFPACRLASDAKSHWTTTEGGVMYAAGAGGTITGFGAGKHRDGFGGCFPYEQLIETEVGQLAIGDIVTKRIPVRVWSWNEQAGVAELMPIDTFWTNPGNDIVEVGMSDGSSFRCTPNHELLTSVGWIEASQLADSLDLVQRKSGFAHGMRTGLCWVNRYCDYIRRVFWLVSPVGIWKVCRNASPGLAQLDLPNDPSTDAVPSGDACCAVHASEYRHGLFARKSCARSPLEQREGAVSDGILHVLGLCAPREVCERIYSAVSVKVASFIRIWSASYESFKDKVRDVSMRHLAAHRKVNAEVALAVVAGFEQAHGGCPANPAHVGDLVKPFCAGYFKPAFVRDVGHVDVTFCLEVRTNHNFVLAQSGAIVSNCIILDDPHKADEARSDVMRQNVIDWFQNTLESRKNSKETPIILIMQRLHERDLAGWLLDGGNGEEWEHVCLPAIQADGTALWPEKHTITDLRRMEKAAPYVFAGQYMQRPAPPEGGIIKPDAINVIDALPAEPIKWIRGWDLAASVDGDYTAGAKLGKLPDGRLIIGDMVHLRCGPDERDAALINTASRDGKSVRISLPQDPGQAGKTQVLYLTRKLAGYPVTTSPESGDKVTRAEPLAAQINVGNVMMVRGPWNDGVINEMRMFPNGTNDDQIDALSRAFSELIAPPEPARAMRVPHMVR
jgi:predicted phage terminase large subunit-like protein